MSQPYRKDFFDTIDPFNICRLCLSLPDKDERFFNIYTYIHEGKTLKKHINDLIKLNVHTHTI